jgi:hypothetical protein
MHYLYGSRHRVKKALEALPKLKWDALLVKVYGPEKPLTTKMRQYAMINWYGKEQRALYPHCTPYDRDSHAVLIHARALEAALLGWEGFFVDAEMYGDGGPSHFPDEPLPEGVGEASALRWKTTAMRCLDINPLMVFGGTSFLRTEPNGVYDAAVRGVSAVKPWHEFTQATFAAGWNRWATERCDAVNERHENIRWIGGVDVSRQDLSWLGNTERWPEGSDVWVMDAEELLKRDAEYIDALFAIGKPEVRAGEANDE